MNVKAITLGMIVSLFLMFPITGTAESEKIMVDKEEYEQLKAAVKFLMSERETDKQAVQEAKQAAEEATEVAEAAVEAAEAESIDIAVGPLFTADLFYGPDDDSFKTLQKHGVLGVEMEVAVLYTLAAAEGAQALGLVTVSDDIVRGTAMSSKDREDTFDNMARIALSLA